jgi:hypothetical protein
MFSERFKELIGMIMIGDGVLAFLEPERHAQLWQAGPPAWEQMMEPFVRRPELGRWLGAAGILCGIWLASRQRAPRHPTLGRREMAELATHSAAR